MLYVITVNKNENLNIMHHHPYYRDIKMRKNYAIQNKFTVQPDDIKLTKAML